MELKNSNIGDGTKISHLTYVGDSDVGEKVNLGCGVVFVNYDGKNKNRSSVGDGAFVGCNVNLVSPVNVGSDAYIAAGSTITEDVPDGAMASPGERQSIKRRLGVQTKDGGKAMTSHRTTIKVFSGNSNPELAEQIANQLHLPLGKAEVSRFSDGEISCQIQETVRGYDVFIVQSTSDPVNDHLMELLIMIDACRRRPPAASPRSFRTMDMRVRIARFMPATPSAPSWWLI